MVLYEQKHLRMTLYQAMEHLSEKQYRRLSAHLFQRMSISEIAHAEGISKASIQDSIEQALEQSLKFCGRLYILILVLRQISNIFYFFSSFRPTNGQKMSLYYERTFYPPLREP